MQRGGGRAGSCSVFVGNIPYGIDEPQLVQLFSQAGPVVSFRLVTDKETNKPKGYGFCEFRDSETAQSAIRNLNNMDLNGRQLRVDSADKDTKRAGPGGGGGGGGPGGGPGMGGPSGVMAAGAMDASFGPDYLVGMSDRNIYDVLKQFKGFSDRSPNDARQLLVSNPHLTQALLQVRRLSLLSRLNRLTARQRFQRMTAPAMTPPPPGCRPSSSSTWCRTTHRRSRCSRPRQCPPALRQA